DDRDAIALGELPEPLVVELMPHLTGNSIPVEESAGDRHAQEQGPDTKALQPPDHELEAAPFGGTLEIRRQLLRVACVVRSRECELFVGIVGYREMPSDLSSYLPVTLQ